MKTTGGLVVITGCAHPGVLNMVRKAREITGEDRVHLVVGGFHLGGVSPSRIESIAEELRLLAVEKVAPCHCSGDGSVAINQSTGLLSHISCRKKAAVKPPANWPRAHGHCSRSRHGMT